MVFIGPGWYNTDGVILWSLLWAEQMLRRLATSGLMVEDLQKVHANVGVMSFPKVGVFPGGVGTDGA